MVKQVITIGPDGEVSGLQRKKGQGVNLQCLGHAKTERVSEIAFDEETQRWYVTPIRGAFAGTNLTTVLWVHFVGKVIPQGAEIRSDVPDWDAVSEPIFFQDYDDAVKAEIAFLDAARLRGVF